MLTLPAKIFLCKDAVSMRKSFEGLGAIIEQLFPGELLSGSLFVFLNRQRDCMKVLFWDRDGFAIWYKRLQKGSLIRRLCKYKRAESRDPTGFFPSKKNTDLYRG